MQPRPFRFGVSVATAGSGVEWQAKARRAEALGFSALLIPDHLSNCLSPWSALAAAAAATEELRVGTFVLNNDFRHPVLTAREAATLDLLSGGRLELGLGAGHMRREYDEAGLRFDSAGVRVDRLGESLAIVKALLAGDAVDYEGSHYEVRSHAVWPRPARPPPIIVGGNGDRLLALAAREADIVGLAGFSPRRGGTENDLSAFTAEGIETKLALIRESAHDRLAEVELNALVQGVVVTDDRRGAAEEMALRRRLSAEEILDSPFLLIGTHDQMAEALVGRRERYGISYWVVFEQAMEALAPVVKRLRDS
jgi:probable F420-dependent oxidoreductase